MDIIDFNNKRWIVLAKVSKKSVDDIKQLKKSYSRADLIVSDKRDLYYVLEEIIDAEFTKI